MIWCREVQISQKPLSYIRLPGGFNLHKWNSNSVELLKLIQQSEFCLAAGSLSNSDEKFSESSGTGNMLLDISWNNLRDEFAFDFSELLHNVSKLPEICP